MRNLKNVFFVLMLFYISFHFLMPITYYSILGYTPTYQNEFYDFAAISIGAWVNILSIVVGAICIFLTKTSLPSPFDIKWNKKRSVIYLFIVILFVSFEIYQNASFADRLHGMDSPKGFNVLGGQFFNLDLYILFAFVSSVDFIPEVALINVIFKIIFGSRSAPLALLNIFLCAFASPNFKKYWKKFTIYMVISFIFSIAGYKIATQIRNNSFLSKFDKHSFDISDALGINRHTTNTIVGRISFLENSMLPIHHKIKENKKELEIFYRKYSPQNQIKITLNNLIPGDIFAFDVYPNQYYRAAFLNVTEEICRRDYTSINITLPVYIYMYLGFIPAIIVSGLLVWCYYISTLWASKIHPLFSFVLLFLFVDSFLAFFDLVMVVKTITFGCVGVVCYLLLDKIWPVKEKIIE